MMRDHDRSWIMNIWDCPKGFGYENIFEVQIAYTSDHLNIYLSVIPLPVIPEVTDIPKVVIGKVNIRLVPGDNNKKPKVWRTSRVSMIVPISNHQSSNFQLVFKVVT